MSQADTILIPSFGMRQTLPVIVVWQYVPENFQNKFVISVTFVHYCTLINYRKHKGENVVDKKESFNAAIKENEGFIFKIASVYTNNREDKHDLIQEILYQLWKSFDTFSQKSSVSTWVYRVALNVELYQLKLSKKRVLTIPIDEQIFNTHEIDNKDSEERWKVFKQQIDNLNLLDKAIVMLYLDNKSYDEIAEIIGISKTNVGTKLLRIKLKLKSQINKNI